MGILTSLFTGVSGLSSNGNALSVIGDNIANSNTTGFKGSRAIFGDILSQALGGGSAFQIGRGVSMQSVEAQFTQGTLESTSNPLDLAIEGDGFFLVNSTAGATYYTRAGQFHLDRDGNVINPEGLLLQGYLAQQNNALGTINVASINSQPNATADVNVYTNLNSNDVTMAGFNIADPTGTSNFSTSITVYDSLGNSHLISVYFTKTAANTWSWNAVANATEVTSTSVSGANARIASGALGFTTNGALNTESAVTYYNSVTPTGVDFTGATANQVIAFDFGTSITTDGGTGLDGTTQFGSPSSVFFQSQDGFTSGSLQSLIVDQNGVITGVFTNGQVQEIASVAISRFVAPLELSKIGRNLYAESSGSGQPIIGTAGTSGRGRVLANSLEASNVDLAEEFVKMIAAQRGFQANTRVITTTDDMLTELMNIKR
ncbi:MAG: flagellar hook protein FlgE [Dissulfurispiraceae bacterium]|jgi:flagellar hook protein FlgE|nr:flagellar hook protein FlgE [Dissulfurispiraceae bacterium]